MGVTCIGCAGAVEVIQHELGVEHKCVAQCGAIWVMAPCEPLDLTGGLPTSEYVELFADAAQVHLIEGGGARVEYHTHQWAYRTGADPQRGFWECTHVNSDQTPCSARQADNTGIPYAGTGVHMSRREET